jgi:hypothetical protein
MPVTYKIDTQERVIRTQCIGMVTLADVVDHFRDLVRDPDCAGSLDVMLDLSETNSVPEARELQAIPFELSRIRDKVRFGACAIVATKDALFGMLRMFAVMAERFFRAIQVFRSRAEAETWLVLQRQASSQAGSGAVSAGVQPEGDEAETP